jgi:hypothetical protein
MLQAAVAGVVDFSQLRLEDPNHRLRLDLLLFGLVAENNRKRLLARAQYHLAAMQVPNLVPEDFEKTQKASIDALTEYENCLQPWLRQQRAQDEQQEVRTLEGLWEQRFGKLDDPETQRGVQETVRQMKEMRRQKREDRERMALARRRIQEQETGRKDERQRRRRRKPKPMSS